MTTSHSTTHLSPSAADGVGRRRSSARPSPRDPGPAPHAHRAGRAGRLVPPLATLWWVGLAVVALAVVRSGGVLPVGDADPGRSTVLAGVPGRALTAWLAVPAVAAAGLALWTWRAGRRTSRALRTSTLGVGGLLLVAAVPLVDATLLSRLGYLPVTLVMATFDPAFRDLLGEIASPAALLQASVLVGAALLAGSLVRFARRTSAACETCGRRLDGGAAPWTTPRAAARWGRTAALVAASVPALYALTRLAWVLGVPLGFSDGTLDEMAEDGAWVAALGLGGFALVGAVLTLGLFQRWGEVFPRWMIGLAGRRVPVRLAVVPATVVAVAVLPAGIALPVLGLRSGALQLTADTWGAVGPTFLWPLWSLALGAATYAYWLRRRGTCEVCDQG